VTLLADKLLIKREVDLLVLDAPDGDLSLLGPISDDVLIATEPGGRYDVVIVFVSSEAAARLRSTEAVRALKAGGALWLCYPKAVGRSAAELAHLGWWERLYAAGLRIADEVAVGSDWSALRFRPA
jgi:hypothetical protein